MKPLDTGGPIMSIDDELARLRAENKALVEAATESAREAKCFCADYVAGQGPCSHCKLCAVLAEALRMLHDYQNGPPLVKYEAQWNQAMTLAESALAQVEGAK